MEQKELTSLIRLHMSYDLGRKKLNKLLEQYRSADYIVENFSKLKDINAISSNIALSSDEKARNYLNKLEKLNAYIITTKSDLYPESLRQIYDPPSILHCIGNTKLLHNYDKIIAIVGSRVPTYNSIKIAKELSIALSERGYIIVSGLASGIDKTAHEVIYQGFPTIAVMGTGIDNVYPSQNIEIYNKIKNNNNGLIISETLLNSSIKSYQFPMRNRIIAGLARAGIIIQASNKSGSLITAQFIIDGGDKDLFVVPGFASDDRFGGSHKLLKSGAHLVTNVDDIIELLDGYKASITQNNNSNIKHDKSNSDIDMAKNNILNSLDDIPIFLETLQLHCNLENDLFMRAILELEIEGKIKKNYDHTVYKI